MLRTTQQLNLDSLTEFNRALVCCFEVENSLHIAPGDMLNIAQHRLNQYKDMATAYDYAQQVLAEIRDSKGIANITPAQVLEWINQIHSRIAATMAADSCAAGTRVVAGEYVKDQVIRWRCGYQLQSVLISYLRNQCSQDTMRKAIRENGIDAAMQKGLLKLLPKLRSDWTGQFKRYHAGQLTIQERQALEHIMKICMPPERVPQVMQAFAVQFVDAWQGCDPNDEDQVCRLAYLAFREITEIHPYFNCNGRTATCWMNIVLRTMNKPSILLRLPGERDNAFSAYCQAITGINTQPELFIDLVKQRIRDAVGAPYTNSKAEAVFAKRMELSWYVSQILRQFPSYPLAPAFNELTNQADAELELGLEQLLIDSEADVYHCQLIAATQMVALLAALHMGLLKQSQPIVQRVYTEAEKKAIIAKLAALTGLDENKWRCYKTAGLTVLCCLGSNGKDASDPESTVNVAWKIANALNKTKALNAIVKLNKADGLPVLCLDNINPNKLNVVESLGLENVQQEQSIFASAAASM